MASQKNLLIVQIISLGANVRSQNARPGPNSPSASHLDTPFEPSVIGRAYLSFMWSHSPVGASLLQASRISPQQTSFPQGPFLPLPAAAQAFTALQGECLVSQSSPVSCEPRAPIPTHIPVLHRKKIHRKGCRLHLNIRHSILGH